MLKRKKENEENQNCKDLRIVTQQKCNLIISMNNAFKPAGVKLNYFVKIKQTSFYFFCFANKVNFYIHNSLHKSYNDDISLFI